MKDHPNYRVYPWPHEQPYKDKNARDRQEAKAKPVNRSPFPWDKMSPGESFYIPIDNLDTAAWRSLTNTIRNSARNYGIYIRYHKTNEIEQYGMSLKVIHDGVIKR